jgi:hypothetical protein
MPQHAQERRTVKIAKSPKMTAFLETAPLAALATIAFSGSCGNIMHFFGACGITGVFRYGDTACPDLLCLAAVREIFRDRRLNRNRKFGWVSWPMLVLISGIAMTLVLGYIGDDKTMLATIAGSWVGHMAGPLPGAVLLLALSMLHRRDTGTAGSGTGRRRGAGTAATGQKAGAPVPAAGIPVPAADELPVPAAPSREIAASTAEPGERSDEELLRDARAYRDELAVKGERVSKEKLRLRFTIGSSKALELARTLREDEQDDTSEAVV